MHQPDPSADLSARKMAHPADVPRRGSGASPSPLTLTGGPGLGGGHLLSSEDYQQSPMLVQPPLPASSSSPGPQQHPPQTLNLMPQPGAQMMKKKSGFQITSVTPAQISANMSSNNSIAEDTESYDDLDESHTEDLSSSEILDVSLSRATDLGGPERSSSEETLNNFQEAETPGAVSPNQPHLHQPLPAHVQQNIMINGNVHHPHHLHHPHHHHHGLPTATHPGFPSAPLSGTSQNAAPIKLATQGSTDSAVNIGPASSAPSGPNVGTVPPLTRKASGPVSTGVNPVQGSSTSHNINIQNISVTGPLPTNVSSTNVTSSSNVSAVSGLNTNVSLSGNGGVASSNLPNNVSNAAVGSAPGSASVPQQAAPLAVTSRFRVVKLDSSTEPFKKGRWTCMEFYDKENTAAASEGAVVNKAVESVKQNPLEVTSERESTSGSSVSSNISTLSHYTESVGSGEMGAPAMQGFPTLAPQQMDFSNPLTQNVPASNIPQSVSQPQLAQLHIHSQDVTYSPQKQVGQATTTSINPAVGIQATAVGVQPATVNILGVASSLGHQQAAVPAMIPQQLPYPQQTQPIQTLPTVPQQQLQYAHQQTAPTQLTTGHVMPANQSSVPGNLPEYLQHPQMLQTAVGPVQSNSAAVGSTATVPVVQAQVLQAQMQSSSAQPPPTCVASTQPVVHAQTTLSATGSQVVGVAQQGSLPVHQASAGQASPPVMQQNVPTPSQQVLPPAQGIQVAASAHPQPVMIAPQNPLLPSMPPTQLLEPALQGMATQQVPAVSPIPAATNVSAVPQLNTGIPPGISPATTTLGPPPTVTQLSTAQNGNLVQSGSQAPLMSALPIAQNVALQMAAGPGQFLVTSLVQSVASQIEDARRLEQSMAGLPHAGEGAMLDSSGNLQGPGSLLPLKSLPLTTPLVDGEDDSSSGASVVAIDNKIEQAMDLVKSHLMYAVREEVEVLKEQIKELIEKNSQLEQENNLLKNLASPEQLAQFQAQLQSGSPPSSSSQPVTGTPAPALPTSQSSGPSA
ncbi:TSC22 domain family protein 1 isoform X2 [Rana temporaria]|uniref:TSC22 domain family protein 1 isoform X2 n=1 Tax=Rana temporaria TaxID=8407 RepID=UPI001AAE0604|nr:TSC22 domain family protein 1 isoform X2 [Rana temporaria]